MLDSSTALVHELYKRGHVEDAQFYTTAMIYDAYFTLNKDEWVNQENQSYRKAVENRFKEYYKEFKQLYESIPQQQKAQIIMSLKNRMFGQGLLMEHITFDDWMRKINAEAGSYNNVSRKKRKK